MSSPHGIAAWVGAGSETRFGGQSSLLSEQEQLGTEILCVGAELWFNPVSARVLKSMQKTLPAEDKSSQFSVFIATWKSHPFFLRAVREILRI